MRVFVLCTGRTGSMTFARAAAHATNYTVGHESRAGIVRGRLDYDDQHIEVDNRLSWFLGSLAKQHPDAFFVHLTRAEDEVVSSYRRRLIDADAAKSRRWAELKRLIRGGQARSIVNGFAYSILHRSEPWDPADADDVVRLYCRTVNDNITEFLADRPHVTVDLARLSEQFVTFWEAIGAEGDLQSAVDELAIRHNRSDDDGLWVVR